MLLTEDHLYTQCRSNILLNTMQYIAKIAYISYQKKQTNVTLIGIVNEQKIFVLLEM